MALTKIKTGSVTDDSITSSKLAAALDVETSLSIGGASNGTAISNGAIALKNSGTASKIDFYCESSNAHFTRLQSAPHSAYSGNITLTLPASDGDADQFLQSNGSGVMSWADAGGGGNIVDFVASGTLPNGKPVVLKSNGTIEVVASTGAGSVIAAGTPAVFESASSEHFSVTTLTSTKSLVVYRDNGSAGYGTACILDVSGSSITAGTPVTFESASVYYISVIRLTDTKALVAYQDRGDSNKGTSCILTVSGTSISVGSKTIFEAGATHYVSATMLTATKAMVVYRDAGNSGYGTSCILTVSGTSITAVTPVIFESVSIYYCKVTALSATKAIVAYYGTGSQPITAVVLDVSGTSITAGTPAAFTPTSGVGTIAITTLSTTKALVVYQDNGNSGYGSSRVITVSGSSISAGSTTIFESASTSSIAVTKLTDTKGLVTYRDEPNSSNGTSCILDVSGTSITAGTPVVFEAATTLGTSVTALTPTKALVTYYDGGNSNYGTSCILDNVIGTSLTSTNFVGMSTAAYTNGQTATVAVLGGISSNQTSLTIGATYYVQADGTLSTTADTPSVIAGRAVSATTLILKGL